MILSIITIFILCEFVNLLSLVKLINKFHTIIYLHYYSNNNNIEYLYSNV